MAAATIPLTQKAAILESHNTPYVVKTDYPVKQPSELAPGECLIKLEYTGVCHSDLHVRNGDWASKSKLPLIGGHEGIGHVVAIGEHSATTVKIGDRVGVKWIGNVCGQCVIYTFIIQRIIVLTQLTGVKCVAKDTNRVGLLKKYFGIVFDLMHISACHMSFASSHGYRVDGTFQEYAVCLWLVAVADK